MDLEVKLAHFEFTTILLVVFGCVLPANLIKYTKEAYFVLVFDKKANF